MVIIACWEVCEYFMGNRNTIKIDSPNEFYIKFGSLMIYQTLFPSYVFLANFVIEFAPSSGHDRR